MSLQANVTQSGSVCTSVLMAVFG